MNVAEFIEWVAEQERTQGVSLATYELFVTVEDCDEEEYTLPTEHVSLSVRFSRVVIDAGVLIPEVEEATA